MEGEVVSSEETEERLLERQEENKDSLVSWKEMEHRLFQMPLVDQVWLGLSIHRLRIPIDDIKSVP